MSGYFNELNNTRSAKIWYYILQGLILILIGIGILVLPRDILEILLVVGFVLLLINGLGGVLLVLTKRANHKLFPQIAAKSALTLALALIILFRPVFALELLLIGIALLMVFRATLIGVVLRQEKSLSISKRAFMIFSLVISVVVVLSALVSILDPNRLFALFMAAFFILEGVEELLYAKLYASNARKANEFLADESQGKYEITQNKKSGAWVMIDPSQYKKALVVAPHPDDLEGFCGGLVFSMKAPVTSVVMAGGNKGVWEEKYEKMVAESKESYIKIRLDESEEAGKLLGVGDIIYMGYLDREVEHTEKSVESMRKIIEEIKPDLIVSFEYKKRATLYPHPDHMATANTVKDAVEKCRSEGMEFDYLLASTLIPNRFIDVTSVRKIKLTALAKHTTQSDLNSIIFPIFEKMLTRLWGFFTNSTYVEGYREVLPKQ